MRTVTSSPHFHSSENTQNIMLKVLIALVPSALWGVVVFGIRALLVILISVLSSVITEYILGRISHENTIWDLSAAVTGLLIGMNMSPAIPLFIPFIASVFAIAVVKWTFGGLGSNWANPAIAGRLFVFFSFTTAMSTFVSPMMLDIDIVGGATPLSLIKTVISGGEVQGLTSLQILESEGYPVSAIGAKLSNLTGFNAYNIDAFIGFIPGCIGEVSKLLLLAGFIFLLTSNVVTYHIPVSYISSYAIFTWIFGGCTSGLGLFHGEVFSSLWRGGLILGALFMATDYATTPVTHKGQLIFGAGCGFFTFLFRVFGSLPEAASVSILMMNIVTPTIDRFCKPRKFGDTKKRSKSEEAVK